MGPSAGSADTMNPGEIVFDDLKLFKRALSDDEVINLYNESSALMYFTQDGAVTEPSRLTGDAVLNFMLKAGEHGNTAKNHTSPLKFRNRRTGERGCKNVCRFAVPVYSGHHARKALCPEVFCVY